MADRVDLALAQRLADEATPGEWVAVVGSGPKRRKQQVALVGVKSMRGQGEAGCLAVLAGLNGHRADDAEFIAAARSLVPALVAELVGLREATDRIRQLHAPSHFRCKACNQFWPCPTVAILDGDPK